MKDKEDRKERENLSQGRESEAGDIYDVYKKAGTVHSKQTDMTEDYTLTRYDVEIYNQQLPKFIREQRKVVRIIESHLIIPMEVLEIHYKNKEKARQIYKGLQKEFSIIKNLLIGETDETVIMARSPAGEVIKAHLKLGLPQEIQDEMDREEQRNTVKGRLMERGK